MTPSSSAAFPVRLIGVHAVTPRTRLVQLDLEGHPFRFAAGQAVLLGTEAGGALKPYSVACAPADLLRHGWLELLMPADGVPQPPLVLSGPFGSFALPPADDRAALVLVAGGTGIAPLRAMLREELAASAPRALHVLYSARHAKEFAFLDELRAAEARGLLRLHLTVTRAGDDWAGARGRIDATRLGSVRPDGAARWLLCGPPAFVDDVSAALDALGVARRDIRFER